MSNSKIKYLIILGLGIVLISCNATKKSSTISYGNPNVKQALIDEYTFKIEYFSNDPTYGYTQENPIMVGGALTSEGPLNERRFLNALTGPNGEELTYRRLGSCCIFSTKNSTFQNSGLLDMYSITYSGLKEPITLYINMYDSDILKVPINFNLKYKKDVKPFVAHK
jgi:hypothetical protein